LRTLHDCKLYVITGENYHPGRPLEEVMEAAIRGGADIVQLRDKHAAKAELLAKARSLRRLTRRHGILFIVNDDVELALASDADGVHLGQGDMPLAEARRIVGKELLIGISTHHIAQALEAERAGADYVGVGPVYPTATKPGRAAVTTSYVAEAAARLRIPFFAIGGISPETAEDVLAAGARRLCAVSAVVGQPDPAAACILLKRSIERWEAQDAKHGQNSATGGQDSVTGGEEVVAAAMSGRRIALQINGEPAWSEAASLRELAGELGLIGRRVVAEVNGDAVPRADWDEVPIRAGDRVEFVRFVGGG